ncbi:MAG: 3-hydroxyanthranilate 3,4-dioxygenase [Bacteroidetes bacterium]|nr:MAG: 3-hydroxyanthranilate 3,4-dioxygenase [Bacteroidota bacterium]REK05802.1 MAG: 3-hydroxyanthranilate 3,4-dioxygenase [Bacteroidota bacterium]REK31894.1 MAG: 3-hydroxyanthranilate 3,4-dioxygenase [Bacteroidota bacterium]REK49959.1 MAG: 3-hydroxyanthranilate 3,4-dioxygenase [Bacteroidota bacterium]
MAIQRAFNFKKWIDDNRHLLKPPVGNQVVYTPQQDFIIMVVGGPNSRKDYHYNETEEFFYQLEGDIVVKIIEDGKPADILIKEGEIFLLPAGTPHSPQRGPNTVGLVVEAQRRPGMKDGFLWYCEKCDNLLYEEYFILENIVTQFPAIMEKFYGSIDHRTCKKCGHVMEPPAKL